MTTTTTTRAWAGLLAGLAVVALSGCGPTQQDEDKAAASDIATKFVQATYKDKCQYDAKYPTQADVDRCVTERSVDKLPEPSAGPWSVQAAEPWGSGYAVKLKGPDIEVVGLVKVGSGWKVSKYDTTSEAVATQSDWACKVIGCGGKS